MDPKQIEHYRTVNYRDIYAKWHMSPTTQWEKPWVKAAFVDVKVFITTKVADKATSTTTSSNSCFDLDVELIEILERHCQGNVASYQSIFVALILEALEMKKMDAYAKKQHSLLTYGYKCHLLSFILARLLDEGTIENVIALYKDESAKRHVLGYFDLL